ncbi:MAG: 3-phosphoglycerate dehydrogenase [Anaerolineaceae bacterium 4572_32.1]|nr:MAG: 3-phosphoglycerate dehydrogenase [Anaerolineaceae bacterium 4572_32.1]
MKIIICDPTAPSAIEAMRKAGIEVDVRDDITPQELETVIADYDGMVVRSRTKVRETLIDKAANLKVIIRGGVGLDNIDVKYAESKGIEVRNTPSASSNSVAELTIGYLLALVRQIPQLTASMKAGKWEKKAFSKGSELSGKTLGLIGCGNIGRSVAQKAAALGMNVIFYRRTPTEVPGATQVSLDKIFTTSDFISLHVPHTPETHYIIGAEALAKMKEGVYIINCGRGGTLDEAALYEAIASGKVAGAALDVYEDEKQERGKRFMDLPQVIGSPHIGAGTSEAKARVGEEVAQIAIEVANR